MLKKELENLIIGLYLGIVIITSTPFFLKHFTSYSYFLIAAYSILMVLLALFIRQYDLRRIDILNHHLPWMLCVSMLAILNIILYPISQNVNQPSTAPQAMIEPAMALFRFGVNPYSIRLYDGAPISPGPGWIILNSPFALSGSITLLTPAYLFFCAGMISKWSKAYAFGFIAMLAACLCFLQMSFVGHDLPAIGLAMAGITLALYQYHNHRFLFILIALLTGILATARIPFIVIPIALGACLYTMNRRRALQFTGLSTGLAIIFHLIFYIWTVREGLYYQPLHVIYRAAQASQPALLIIGGIFWIVAVLFAWHQLNSSIASWSFFLWVFIAIPFILIGFGELMIKGIFSATIWAGWEGKVYIMFTLPLLITAIIMNLIQRLKIPSVDQGQNE